MKPAIIVDLDSTLANVDYKSYLLECRPKKFKEFYARIPEDKLNHWCAEIIKRFRTTHKIFYITGREGTTKIKSDTLDWLNYHDLMVNAKLFHRSPKDYRHDIVIKKEIYESNIKENYKVSFVLEDRKAVVDMWRKEELTCLQCKEGDY